MRLLCLVLFVFLLLISFASAQLAGVENQIQGAVDNLENNITKIKEFGEKDKWDFIGSQWKEFLLKNKAIAGVNTFFTKINIVFVVLFGMDWGLSMQILFAFLLWIFTLFSLIKYILVDNKWLRLFYSFIGVLGLAQLHFFFYLSELAVMLVFLKTSSIWRITFIITPLVLIFLWYKLNCFVSHVFEKRRENKRKERTNTNEKKIEKVVEGIESGMK